MPVDPQVVAYLDEMARLELPPLETLSPESARQQMREGSPEVDEHLRVVRVEDLCVPGPRGPIPLRLYYPDTHGPHPVVVYFHGGGWVLGDLETHHAICHALAFTSGCLVAAVDYRLAPEHRFPAAVDDAYAATLWIAENASSIAADRRRVAVAGDSAGGNLAAVVAMRARDAGAPEIALQILVYPITDCDLDTPSYMENASGYQLTRELMAWFWRHYAPGRKEAEHPDASPLRAAHLGRLPRALVLTAEYDPLRDEGETFARRLEEAGVSVELIRYDGMIHGFFRLTSRFHKAREALNKLAAELKTSFGLPSL